MVWLGTQGLESSSSLFESMKPLGRLISDTHNENTVFNPCWEKRRHSYPVSQSMQLSMKVSESRTLVCKYHTMYMHGNILHIMYVGKHFQDTKEICLWLFIKYSICRQNQSDLERKSATLDPSKIICLNEIT